MQRITDLFIDFDDTIYDTHGNAEIALQELFDTFHLERYYNTLQDFTTPYWLTNMELWGLYSRGEITRDYLIIERFRRPLSKGRGLNPTIEYCLQVSDTFFDLCSSKINLVEDARDLLEYLQPRYRLHMCSNGFHEVQFKKLKASDTARYFTSVILSEDAGANKPSPIFFEYALRTANVKKDNTMMLGDNLDADILGAINSGIDAIYFNRWKFDRPLPLSIKTTVCNLSEIITRGLL